MSDQHVSRLSTRPASVALPRTSRRVRSLRRRQPGNVSLSSVDRRAKSGVGRAPRRHLVFNSDDWFAGWMKHWQYDPKKIELFNRFRNEFIDVFKTYPIPVIQLRRSTSKEAVCLVFEKVNTGGVSLTAFELLTATFAADGFNLREDWYGISRGLHRKKGRADRLGESGVILRAVENTDFLQAVSLLYTYDRRQKAIKYRRGRARCPSN
jgi:hypothetical protein